MAVLYNSHKRKFAIQKNEKSQTSNVKNVFCALPLCTLYNKKFEKSKINKTYNLFLKSVNLILIT